MLKTMHGAFASRSYGDDGEEVGRSAGEEEGWQGGEDGQGGRGAHRVPLHAAVPGVPLPRAGRLAQRRQAHRHQPSRGPGRLLRLLNTT